MKLSIPKTKANSIPPPNLFYLFVSNPSKHATHWQPNQNPKTQPGCLPLLHRILPFNQPSLLLPTCIAKLSPSLHLQDFGPGPGSHCTNMSLLLQYPPFSNPSSVLQPTGFSNKCRDDHAFNLVWNCSMAPQCSGHKSQTSIHNINVPQVLASVYLATACFFSAFLTGEFFTCSSPTELLFISQDPAQELPPLLEGFPDPYAGKKILGWRRVRLSLYFPDSFFVWSPCSGFDFLPSVTTPFKVIFSM